ncbi:NUDIX domain-containing protein [Candidatus Woesearchaeota archaeon]|nr:NUDIX domain-containing protein [Candidatus Woesearchaeota archaeon]MBW3016719.1 NUDIX domain-containing protein [Candidatus Woesearchaeota archaeon]
MMKRPGVGVGVFVKKGGKILLQRRIGAHGAHTWSLPGGHLEFGESPEETAAREAKEEVNVDIKNSRVVGATNDVCPEDGTHYITIFVEAEYAGGEAKICEADKTSDFGWFSKDEIPSPLFLPLKNFLENKRLF